MTDLDTITNSDFRETLDGALRVFFKGALKIALSNPLQAYYFIRTLKWQKKAAKTRAGWDKQGIHVPPIMIFSITNRCNLHCKGCYHQALRQSSKEEMSKDKVRSVITEAKELGISFEERLRRVKYYGDPQSIKRARAQTQ